MSYDERILFDQNAIDHAARQIERFRADFLDHVARIDAERHRSVTTFVGLAGDAFRQSCGIWSDDATEFAAILADVSRWLDTVDAGYADARSASRSMFAG